MKDGIYMATPEKALLDEVYFVIRGKATLDFDELDIKKLSPKTLKDYYQRFPDHVRNYIKKMIHP